MTEAWYYKPGDNYILDDISGFKVRRSKARMIPGGQTGRLWVDRRRYEDQHPQDFVRGVIDQQVPEVVRPRQVNQFVIVGSWITAYTPAGSDTLPLDSTDGFQIGRSVVVALDNGDVYYPTIADIVGNALVVFPALPRSVGGSYASPLENTVVDFGPGSNVIPPIVVGTDDGFYLGDDAHDLISAVE